MKAIITGVAGFIGSSIAQRLLEDGHSVTGIDCFLDYYARDIKEQNLAPLRDHANFTFHEKTLLQFDWPKAVADTSVIFHQAAQAGVRASWGSDFQIYCDSNIMGTQVVLEAAKAQPGVKIVYASSSSVYGETQKFPMHEDDRPQPVSPYGVSKLAAEHLCVLYTKNFKVPTVSLRYFTVYGPKQRPDMAFHRFIRAMLEDREIVIYGNGEQTRDFTFIADAVQANLEAAERGRPGAVYNIGGGSRVTVNEVLKMLHEIMGIKPKVKYIKRQKGDVTHTYADTTRAHEEIGYKPLVSLREGLAREAEWVKNNLSLLQRVSR